MRIERIETILVGSWLLLEISTDNGLTGLGEAGLWGYPEASERVIDSWKSYLMGKDPLDREHHWQYLYRNSHFRGGAVTAALAAIDISLWDIAGKYYQTPVYQLLGGKCRDRVRVYLHVDAKTPAELAQRSREAVDTGFTVVRISPFQRDFYQKPFAAMLDVAVARTAAVRAAIGTGVDLGVEIHRRLGPAEAIALARELEPFRILFYEDPIIPDSVQSVAEVAKQVPLAIATGERLHTIFEFRELLVAGGCHFIRPDVCLAGGLTQTKKIAALAESFHVGVMPHNPLSPVSTAACVQLAACIPNFVLQTYTWENRPPKSVLFQDPLKLDNGYLAVPDLPGIGMKLNHAAIAEYPFQRRPIVTPLAEDGSVVDQ